jgi:hypothetical protein
MLILLVSVFNVVYFAHSMSQAWKKEDDCGRLMASAKFSYFIMIRTFSFTQYWPRSSNGLTHNVARWVSFCNSWGPQLISYIPYGLLLMLLMGRFPWSIFLIYYLIYPKKQNIYILICIRLYFIAKV